MTNGIEPTHPIGDDVSITVLSLACTAILFDFWLGRLQPGQKFDALIERAAARRHVLDPAFD